MKREEIKKQVENLTGKMGNPDQFTETLYNIFRENRGKCCETGVKTFCTPVPVIKTLAKKVGQSAEKDPDNSFELFKKLWDNGSREEMILVSRAIGNISDKIDHEKFLKTIMDFVHDINEKEVCDNLAKEALASVSLEHPQDVLSMSRVHVRNISDLIRRFGVLTMKKVLEGDEFQDFDSIFKTLTPVMRESEKNVRSLVVSVIRNVAKKDPRRSFYFMKKWAKTASSETKWIIKRGMKSLPKEEQKELKEILEKKL